MNDKKSAALEVVKLAHRVLEEKKAGEITVMDVSEQSSITDFLVVATATSSPHLRALRVELEKAFDAAGVHLVGMEAPHESGWYVIDAFDVMIHLFNPEMRQRYALDRLWRDAVEVDLNEVVKKPKAKSKAKPKAKVAKAPKKAKPEAKPKRKPAKG